MKTELEQLQKMETWKLVSLPGGRKPMGCKWVFSVKLDENENPVHFRAQLVAKGYSQIPRQDFDQTFSPVMRLDSLRNLIAIAAIHDLDMCILDVKSAYLHGDLDETIYMEQPKGFNDGTPQVCLLIHSLYGLKQSGRAWNKTLDTHLKDLGYQQLNADHCIVSMNRRSPMRGCKPHLL